MEKIDKLLEYKWHVVYIRSRAEKKAAIELLQKNIETYLPLQRKLRQWSDRKKWVEMTLISGYLFVYISRKEYDIVLQSNYVVSYVRFEGKAAIIPERQIESLKIMLSQDNLDIDVTPQKFEIGQRIEVISGPLIGVSGKLVNIKGNHIAFYAYTTYGVYFLIGMLCYAYRSKIVINAYWLPVLVVLFIGITCYSAFSFAGFIFIPALILYLSANGVNWVRKITPRADLSYGIYLFAYPVQQIAANYLHPGKSIYLFLLTVFISVPFALVSWYCIESKALQMKNLIK